MHSIFAAAVSEPEANERGSSLIGRKKILRNARDCGQRRMELCLCANEGINMGDNRACSVFQKQ